MVEAIKERNDDDNATDVNIEQLVHLKAFQTGYLTFDRKFHDESGLIYGTKRKLTQFDNTSSFLPFTPIDRASYGAGQPFIDLPRPYREGFVPKVLDEGEAYDAKLEKNIQDTVQYISRYARPIEVLKANLQDKPVAIIYNPTSGNGKKDIRAQIEQILSKHGITAIFYETQRYMHGFELANNIINFSEHSALVAVGGDGTLHEIVNGMLQRPDGQRLPVSFVPNGSGNDLVGCLGVKSVEQALNWLVKGDVVKMDANKVLMDYENEADIPETENRSSKLRYSIINAAVGYVAKIVHNALKQKPYVGRYCYKTSGFTSFFDNELELFDIHIE